MVARVATFDALPDDLNDDAVDLLRETVRGVPGYVAGFHLRDPDTGKALSVAVFEDRAAIQRCRQALDSRPDDKKVGVAPGRVEFYQAFPF